jgi:hypothetical protein
MQKSGAGGGGLLDLLDEGWFTKPAARPAAKAPHPPPPAPPSRPDLGAEAESIPAVRPRRHVTALDLSVLRRGDGGDIGAELATPGSATARSLDARPASADFASARDQPHWGSSAGGETARSWRTAFSTADSLPQVRSPGIACRSLFCAQKPCPARQQQPGV